MDRQSRFEKTGLFRSLSLTEAAEFRQWAREHPDEAKKRLQDGMLCVIHPIVRDEWRRMGFIPSEGGSEDAN